MSLTGDLLFDAETAEELYEHAPCGYLSTLADGTIVQVNGTFLRWTGLRREDVLGRRFRSLLTTGSRIYHDTHYSPMLHLQGDVRGVALDVLTRGGRPLPVVLDSNVKLGPDGTLRLVRTTVLDATERRAQEREMARARKAAEASEGRLRVLYRAAAALAEVTTTAGVAAALSGVLGAEMRGAHAEVWLLDDEQGALLRATTGASDGALSPPVVGLTAPLPIAAAFQRQEVVAVETPEDARRDFPALTTPMLEARVVALLAVPLVVQGAVVGVYQLSFRRQRVFTDQERDLHRTLGREAGAATARVRMGEELRHLALHDPLTGAPNRALFTDRLEQALSAAGRSGHPLAVLFLDLDGFKAVNDSGGHRAGDEVLREVARRLQVAIRPSDSIGRIGGDEFAVLCEGVDLPGAQAVASRLEEEVGRPLIVDGTTVHVTVSVGIAVHEPRSSPGVAAGEMIARADGAMYRAKAMGKNGHVAYDPLLDDVAPGRLEVEGHLRTALEDGGVVLRYQPVVDLRSGAVVGVEALCRLERGDELMMPGEFIGVAEERGLIVPLGRRVMELACAQLATWDSEGVPGVYVAVNVAAEQAARPDFADCVFDVLARTGCPPDRLTLELTESILLAAAPATLAGLERLAAAGIGIVLDDFGTRYASLDYVQRFPLTGLKIDQSFVAHLPSGRAQAAIVRCIGQLAAELDLTCTAEGIETDAQREFIAAMGVRGQGYGLARPLTAEDCLDFIRRASPT